MGFRSRFVGRENGCVSVDGGVDDRCAQGQFYEYALGSAREARNWYFLGRHILGEKVFAHRSEQLAETIRLQLTIIPAQRHNSLREVPVA